MSTTTPIASLAAAEQPEVSKESRCVDNASKALLTWGAGLVPAWGAFWLVGAKLSPAIANTNWRLKAISSSVGTIALSYYKAERAMIDCTQEYEQRAKARRQRLHREALERDAAAAAAAAAPASQ